MREIYVKYREATMDIFTFHRSPNVKKYQIILINLKPHFHYLINLYTCWLAFYLCIHSAKNFVVIIYGAQPAALVKRFDQKNPQSKWFGHPSQPVNNQIIEGVYQCFQGKNYNSYQPTQLDLLLSLYHFFKTSSQPGCC